MQLNLDVNSYCRFFPFTYLAWWTRTKILFICLYGDGVMELYYVYPLPAFLHAFKAKTIRCCTTAACEGEVLLFNGKFNEFQ